MKRFIGVVLVVMVAMVTTQFVAGGEAEAQPGPWSTAAWTNGGIALNTTMTGPATLQVTDYQCAGDDYVIRVDGVVAATTAGGPQNCAAPAATIDDAFASAAFGSAAVPIPAGAHQVQIQHVSGFANGRVAYRLVTGTIGIAHKPICIEADLAQEKAKGLRAGDVFFSDLLTSYVLVTGDGCKYNCIMGFDLNCDGKIGDFCPVELDRAAVNNVKPCLEASVKDTAVATTAAPVLTPVTAPPDSTLAHTGGEDTLAEIGFTLVAAGAAFTALSIRRRRES